MYHTRGAYTVGKEILDELLDKLRRLAEECDDFQGFILYSSPGGGTGSGFASTVTERISVEYGKKPKIAYAVWPSPRIATSVIEDLNAILTLCERPDTGDKNYENIFETEIL